MKENGVLMLEKLPLSKTVNCGDDLRQTPLYLEKGALVQKPIFDKRMKENGMLMLPLEKLPLPKTVSCGGDLRQTLFYLEQGPLVQKPIFAKWNLMTMKRRPSRGHQKNAPFH